MDFTLLKDDLKARGVKFYYEDDDVGIICSDCRLVLPLIPDKSIDLVLTDPPYGIGASSKKFINGTSATVKKYYEDVDWDTSPPPQECLDEIFRISQNQIIWGGELLYQLFETDEVFLDLG